MAAKNSKPRAIVIVGCGPAGVAAAVEFARRGLQVKVFEKRSAPSHISSSNEDRAFVVALNARGRRSLLEAGFDLDSLVHPGSGIVSVSEFVVQRPSWLPWDRMRVTTPKVPSLIGDRMSWVRELVKQAEGMALGIEFFYDARLEHLSLPEKTVEFRLADGSLVAVEYGLLVGADGCHSQVRGELQAALPEFSCSKEPSFLRYKVFRGLDLPEAPGKKNPPVMMFVTKLRVDDPRSATVITVPHSDDGKACGILSMHCSGWEGLESPEDIEARLRLNSHKLPEAWIGLISKQLASRKLNVAGWRVLASQLHGPSVTLIGDAGHGVSPVTGSGMNAALEDAWLLGKLFDSLDGDLDALPEAFTAARLKDAHALLWLDAIVPYRFGRMGQWHWRYLLAEVQQHARRLARCVVGDQVDPAVFTRLGQSLLSFSEVKRDMIIEDVVTGAVLAGAVALAGWVVRALCC